MAKRKYKTAKESTKLLNEPIVAYGNVGKTDSIIISTITEQEESNYRYWLSLTPEERWAEHYALLQRVYGKEKINKNSDFKIIFD